MKLFLDMDGVIADFFGGFEKKFNVSHWKDLEDPQSNVESLKNTNWFNTLEPFDTSAKLVEACRKIAGRDYGICSSPISGDDHNSSYWKRVWLERHGFMPEVPNLIFTGEKHKFANEMFTGEPNILVDDKPSNIKEWIAAGGIGLLYQANESDVDELIKDLRFAFS
jgi:hypothetical protein